VVAFASSRWGDGMTVDPDGNLYVAVSSTSDAENGVYVFSPDGRPLAMLPTPEKAVNVEFGRGDQASVLYVACEHSLYRIRLLRSGYRPTPR
jgi:gluconolactonase